jgi:hypothetical protein
MLFLHVSRDDLEQPSGGAKAEKLGPLTLNLLRSWLAGLDHVSIRPVLDPARQDTVDGHNPPSWMREAVIQRDGHCVFPGCRIDARATDLDHIVAYRSPDEGGPPGQTSVKTLACLCRRHHRAKTLHGWSYGRAFDQQGDERYEWASPHGRRYLTYPAGVGRVGPR